MFSELHRTLLHISIHSYYVPGFACEVDLKIGFTICDVTNIAVTELPEIG